jgi:parallel beta-helix repeat protein
MILGVTPLRRLAILFLVFLTSISIGALLLSRDASAATGINQTINFQGRLFTASGATVPDGYYNIEFKLYQDGAGTAAGNPGGTLLWTESHLNNNSDGVTVRNGFMSVELGSVTAFGSSIDWNQDTIWLSMNIGDTNVSCTPFSSCGGDGEMTPMKRLSAVPYALNAMQLGGKSAGDFIQNQNASVQTAANFWIGGSARADTGMLTPVIDTATGGTLTIGGTNATSIALADDTILAAGKSLTLTGGNTASRPASPVEGMMYFDSDTDRLLVYSGGKWQADRSTATKIVATSASGGASGAVASQNYDGADFVNTSTTAAETVINNAISALPASGGTVYLMEGTYIISYNAISLPNNVKLVGSGDGTVLKLLNNADASFTVRVIRNSDTSTGTGIGISNLKIDGNEANQTYNGGSYAIELEGVGGATRAGAVIENVTIQDVPSIGIGLNDVSNTRVTGNNIMSVYDTSIYMNGVSTNNVISNNVVRMPATAAAGLAAGGGSSSENIISNNTFTGGSNGISITILTKSTITGNTVSGASARGIWVSNASSSDLVISNNRIHDTGGSTANNGIYISNTDSNKITGNKITDTGCSTTCYAINIFDSTADNTYLSDNVFSTTSGTATINDAGTGTIYANQSKTAGGLDATFKQAASATAFQIQNASGAALLTADSASSDNRIQIGSNSTDATAIFFMLDSYNNGSDPSGTDGAMYYNTSLGKFRCYQGAWVDCVNTAGSGANTALSNLASTNINAALNTTAGDLTLQTTTSGNIILNPVGTIELQKATNVTGSLTASTSVLTPALDRASAGALTIGATTATSVIIGNASGATPLTLSASTINVGIATSATTLQATAQTTSNTQGSNFTIQGANGNGTGAGGTVTVQGGNGGATDANGGNLVLSGGTGGGTGVTGLVTLNPTAFTSSSSQSIATDTTLAVSLINNNSTVPVNATTESLKITVPVPTTTTTGRIIYITAANTSNDFSLLLANTSGVTASYTVIGMRQNNTATLVWNGYAWTAAGASSSTDLQSAYNNTLQSAGGAELIVSKTSATNGLTIRDSLTNSVDGTLLSVQTKSAAGLFQVNSNVTEYVSNAGAETAGAGSSTFPSTTWEPIGAATVSRNTVTNNNSIATGQGSVSITTPATAQTGVKNTLVSALGTKQNYNVSFTARLSTGTFTDMNVYYSIDGTTASVLCAATEAIATSVWTKVNCTFSAPTSGITSSNAILIRQTTGVARTMYIDNLSVTIAADYNYATDGSVTDAGNFATNWSTVSGATVTRTTTVGHDASDSAQSVTAATSGQGVRNKLSINPLTSTLYRITVRAASSNSFTDFTIRYTRDGGTNFTDCVDYNTQTISTSTSAFTEVTCYVTTDGTAATDPYVYFTQGSATARTFYVDAFSMNLNSNTTPNVQIGGGSNGGPTTLFTLDRGASAPIASNNEALLGSMYYDTTLGKLQCYEADGWGACGSSPDNIITISPEYTNAVLHGTGVGTMTSDLCSDPLNINDGSSGQPTICGSNETYNFYKWTSPQNSTQTYSIFVTYQLPTTFKSFNSGQASLMGRTDSTNATVNYQIYRNSASGLTACGSTVAVSTGVQTAWQIGTATGAADPSTCGFSAGNSIVFKINMSTSSNANAYVGNLNFAFSNN